MLTQGPGLDTPVEMVGWYADLLDKYEFTQDLGVAEVRGGLHSRWVEKEPVGVVAAIVPYNYPVQITLAKLVPALAAGCTVVVKAPPQTPWITAALGKVVAEQTDIPPGVVNVLTSTRSRWARCSSPTRWSTWSASPARRRPGAASWPPPATP